ncbi:hypothetical protein B0T14DRAFT_569595 [Immersiella caudata]|uniref:Uncharacterized protein n=1 Tax=Immersiella caudata TaxID=314043 RepID=A0AA40BTZ8_9PEZI|nr:hypothetical protein B0T14DRAFT_569595 [Immersiella caudata]
MKALTTFLSIAILVWKAAAVTAVTDCHLHSTQVYCRAEATEYVVATTATATSDVPPAYTGCHAHGSETFCLSPSGDDVQISLSTIEGDEEAADEGPQEEHCHFHAGVEHCVGASGEDGPRSCERTDREYNIPLRIGLLFAILVTSSFGVFAPILLARYLPSAGKSTLVILKQFGTGVIISTSLVHLLTHAQLMFSNECLGELTYEATAAAVAMAGLFLSFLVEYLGHRFVHAKGGNATRTALVSVYVLEAGIIFHSLIIGLTLVVSGDSFLLTLFAVILFHQMFEGMALGTCIAALGSPSSSAAGSGISCHSPAPHGTAAATDDYEALPTASGRQHGLKAGCSTGIGSGTPKISTARKLSLAAAFALVTPAGMAIGIAVLDQFNGNDPQTIVAIGVLDALSAGILLWVGIVEMWAADWAVLGGAMVDAGATKTVTGLGALVAGMVAMSVLGKWA